MHYNIIHHNKGHNVISLSFTSIGGYKHNLHYYFECCFTLYIDIRSIHSLDPVQCHRNVEHYVLVLKWNITILHWLCLREREYSYRTVRSSVSVFLFVVHSVSRKKFGKFCIQYNAVLLTKNRIWFHILTWGIAVFENV